MPTLQEDRDALWAAYIAIASGRVASYKIGERFLTYHNLKDLREAIEACDLRIASSTPGGVRNLVG